MAGGQTVMWVIAGVCVLAALAQVVKHPRPILWRLLRSAVVGCLLLLCVNGVGSYAHYHLPVNPLTVSAAGLLGIPGVAAMVVVQHWLL
ncbi:MAG: pro-sigmaK processing inhibitor BofA family protein [Alicyclobacillaceae bacterium]|nr:pro-sigmaK processing inhibitor BofA family protein [Alicyclobacillaceae bacterium]